MRVVGGKLGRGLGIEYLDVLGTAGKTLNTYLLKSLLFSIAS